MVKISVGDRINHKRFGVGVVTEIDGSTPANATIDFDGLVTASFISRIRR